MTRITKFKIIRHTACHNIEIFKMDPHPQKCSSGAIQEVENNGPYFRGSKMEVTAGKSVYFVSINYQYTHARRVV